MANGRDFLLAEDADGGSHRLPLLRVSDDAYLGRDVVVVMSDEDRRQLRTALHRTQVRTEFASLWDKRLVLGVALTTLVGVFGGLVVEVARIITGR